MFKKILLICFSLLSVGGFAGVAYALPFYSQTQSLIPGVTDTYNIGTSSPSLLEYNNIFTKNITVSGTCTGCGSGGGATSFTTASYIVSTTTATGNFTSLQSAINALPAAGGKIFVRCGTYTLAASTTIAASKVTIEGEGDCTNFQFDGTSVSPAFTTSDYATQRTDLIFKNFLITQTAGGGAGTAINASYIARSVFDHVDITGANIGYYATSSNSLYNRIYSPTISVQGTGAVGIEFTGSANKNEIYSPRIVTDANTTGILFDAHSNTCYSCDVETGALIGVDITASGNNTTLNNPYLEANATNLRVASAAYGVNVVGGTIESATTANITDNGSTGLCLQNVGLQFANADYCTGSVIGLGGANPLTSFTTVIGTTTAQGGARINGNSGSNKGPFLSFNRSGSVEWVWGVGGNNASDLNLELNPASGGTSETDANMKLASVLTVTSANKFFGIGSTSPYVKLAVSGEVAAADFIGTTTATSTLAGGLNLTGGGLTIGTLTSAPLYVDGSGNFGLAGSGTNGNCVKWGANNTLADQGSTCGGGALSGGTAGMLTSWTSSSAVTATGTPTFAAFTSTSTATSTMTGGFALNGYGSLATTTITTLNGAINAAQMTGSDLGIQINEAYASLPSTGGTIIVPAGSYTDATQINFGTSGKPVWLQCQGGAKITYSGSATSTIWNYGSGSTYYPKAGMDGCKWQGPDAGVGSTVSFSEIGGSNGAPRITMTGNVIRGFKDAIHTRSNTWIDNFSNNTIEYNVHNIYVEGANNSGENFTFAGNNIADCYVPKDCVYFEVNGSASTNFVDNSFDDAQLHFLDGNSNILIQGGHFENPNQMAIGQYTYIITTAGGFSNLTLDGVMMTNGATTTAKSPNQYVLNGGTLTITDVSVQSYNGVAVPAMVGGTGNFNSLGIKNINGAFTTVSTSTQAIFAVDPTTNKIGIGTTTPGAFLSVVGSTLLDSSTVTFASSTATSLNLRWLTSASSTILNNLVNVFSFATSTTNTPVLTLSTAAGTNWGRVGIGTTTPGLPLDVAGGIEASNIMTYGSTQSTFGGTVNFTGSVNLLSSSITTSDNGNETIGTNWGWNIKGDATHVVQIIGASLMIGQTAGFPAGATFPTNGLFVAGSVGIGTTSPASGDKLQVSNGVGATTTVEFAAFDTTSKSCINMRNTAGSAEQLYIVGTTVHVDAGRCN